MAKTRLLFVEDDATFSYVIKNSLELSGKYEVQTALDGKEGLEMYHSFNPDVIVADIEMPVLDGMEMVKKIRNTDESIPILLASGQTHVQNVLKGYRLNADNFIKKPYIPEELDAHIQAILRRIKNSIINYEGKNIILIGEYIFNKGMETLQYKDIIYKLTARESQVLEKLYEQKGELITRKYLLEELWGVADFFSSRSLAVFINTLRKRFSCDPNIKIKTVRGKGLILSVK
ncbi:MAG: response regulator transcription factor [Dysgonamonadaceae bacterium]|jgi:DNA-binding response OmpR family regulator|nr:response regulator transcription factor [Dysgonamonadaceae bacterium]